MAIISFALLNENKLQYNIALVTLQNFFAVALTLVMLNQNYLLFH